MATVQEVMDARDSFEELVPAEFRITNSQLHTLQVNVGYKCNIACRHCHLQCGPGRTEEMSRETVITEPNHGLFIGFAPSYDPQYAVAVRIANGYTSGNACLVAADLFDYIFKVKDRDDVVTGFASEETSNTSND